MSRFISKENSFRTNVATPRPGAAPSVPPPPPPRGARNVSIRGSGDAARDQREAPAAPPPPPAPAPGPEHLQLARDWSYVFAAATIADPEFPNEALLPRIDPIPHNNLGHMVMIDFGLVCEALWGCAATIEDRQTHLIRQQFGRLLADVAPWIAMTLLAGVVAYMNPGTLYAVYVAFFVLQGSTIGAVRRLRTAAAAEVRASYIESLIAKRLPDHPRLPTLSPNQPLARATYGDGMLAPTRINVFLANGYEDPFPGLGWVQNRGVYVCALKADGDDAGHTVASAAIPEVTSKLEAAFAAVAERVRESLGARAASAAHGYSIVVDSTSMHPASPWLDGEGRPPLVYERNGADPGQIDSFARQDPAVRARAYLGVQVLMHTHMTMLSVFARVYVASNSLAVELLLVTLGPPAVSTASLRDLLANHRYREAHKSTWLPWSAMTARAKVLSAAHDETWSLLAERLRKLRLLKTASQDPLRSPIDLAGLRLLLARGNRSAEERKEAESLQDVSDGWPGHYTRHANWRERRSLTLPRDLFGAAECKATAHALFTDILSAALNTLDESGFDVSPYRDEGGNLVIKADSIDRMVIGEQIQISESGKSVAKSEAAGE